MHPLPEFDFAGPTTRQRVAEHNKAVAGLDADQADVERLAGQLANLDPLTVDPEAAEQLARTVAHRRHGSIKAAVALYQFRLPILSALEEDRQRAEQEAREALTQRRAETAEGLKAAGYGHLLASDNPVVRRQVVELVDASAPVIAAANRFAELRQQRTTLNEVRMTAHREIAELTAKLRSALRETAAAI